MIVEEEEPPRPQSQGNNNSTKGMINRKNSRSSQPVESQSGIDQDDLEINFQQEVSKVQQFHFQVCKRLMQTYIVIMFLQFCFAFYQLSDCGCFGSESNNLICMVHYVKIIFNLYLTNKYYYNIRDYQSTHPVSNLNFFLMVTFYYGMLFINLSELKFPSKLCVYPSTDFTMVILSLTCIKRAVDMKKELESIQIFKIFNVDMQKKLREVLYLPVSYTSDIEEEADD